ncbi:MAG: hypothetical protein LBS53_12245 [Synergistaceae bacterium]|jgi:hypothetical protein|nr:hypothetical protein [Synergistaceae bacterium]
MKFLRKNIKILARVFMAASIVTLAAMTASMPAWALPGTGAVDDPYLVTTGSELDEAIKLSTDGTAATKVYIKLTEDIDAITTATYDGGKNIEIDGDGKTINGNNIARTSLRFNSNSVATESTRQTIVLKNLVMRNLKTPATSYNYGGGAIGMRAAYLTIENCTFLNNENTVDHNNSGGGAVFVQSGGSILAISNSTFYGNKSARNGGAIILAVGNVTATGTINSSTIVGNEVTGNYPGGGVAKYNSANVSLKVKNSIVAGNRHNTSANATGNDINLAAIDDGYNLFGAWPGGGSVQTGTTSDIDVAAVVVGGPPKVNRQGTPTIALWDDSGAIGAADPNTATINDQRGIGRDVSYPSIGAFEYVAADDNTFTDYSAYYDAADLAALTAMGDFAGINSGSHSDNNSPEAWAAAGVTWEASGNNRRIIGLDVHGKNLAALDVSDLTALETLNCSSNASLATITGLDSLLGLKSLSLSGTGFTTLDVSNLIALESLNCSGSASLAAITGLSDLEFLETLNCSNTAITTLDVTDLIALESLDCSGSASLAVITGLSDLESLETLNCSNTAISALDVSDLTNLKTLNCSNTAITELIIEDLENLETLTATGNAALADIELTNMGSLRTITANNNTALESFTLSGSDAAYKLALSSLNLSGCNTLDTLELSNIWSVGTLNVQNCASLSAIVGYYDIAYVNTFTITGSGLVNAPTYSVSIIPSQHGNVQAGGGNSTIALLSGDKVTFTITPDVGYKLSSFVVNGTDVIEQTILAGYYYSYVHRGVSANVTAQAEFVPGSIGNGGGSGGCDAGLGAFAALAVCALTLVKRSRKG